MTTLPHPPRWLLPLLATLCLLGALAQLWLPAHMPTQDGPHHLLDARVRWQPERFAPWVEPEPVFRVGQGFLTPTEWLTPLLGVDTAARVVLSAWLLLAVAALGLLAHRTGRSPWLVAIVVPWSLVGWAWLMGFFNFLAGVSLGMVTVAVWGLGQGRSRRWLAAPGAALTWIAHPVPAALSALWLGLVSLDPRRPQGRGIRGVESALWMALCAVFLWGSHWSSAALRAEGSVQAHADGWVWPDAWTRWQVAWHIWGVSYAALPVALGTALVVAGHALNGWRPAAEAAEAPHPRWSWVAAAGWAVTLGLPLHLAGWHYASARVFPLLLAVPVVYWTVYQRPLLHWLAAGAGVCAVAGWVASVPATIAAGDTVRTLAEDFGEGPAGTTYVGLFEPLTLPGSGPWATPLIGIAVEGLHDGGALPGLFARYPRLHSIRFSPFTDAAFHGRGPLSTPSLWGDTDPWRLTTDAGMRNQRPFSVMPEALGPEAEQRARADLLAWHAMPWDHLLLVNLRSLTVLQQLHARGYRPVSPARWRPPRSVTVQMPAQGGPPCVGVVWPDSLGLVDARCQSAEGRAWQVPGLVPGPALVVPLAADRTTAAGPPVQVVWEAGEVWVWPGR
jgi:hypothetical protein